MGPGGFGVLVGSFGPDGPGGSFIMVVGPGWRVTVGLLDEDEIEGGGGEGLDGGVAGDGSEGARPTRFSNSLGYSDQK